MEGGSPKKGEMMTDPVVGIICEYDPFHRGHARQFALIRERLPGARILCLMSGCFTQRGMPSVYLPKARAEAALAAGADAVLELPCAFTLREAEHFALGGAQLLTELGFVTHLSFGTEDALPPLKAAAELLEAPSPEYTALLRRELDKGESFAKAQGTALSTLIPSEGDLFARSNNILAISYLRALIRLKSPIIPLPVHREGDYHSTSLEAGYPSATAVRAAIFRGEAVEAACGWNPPRSPVCKPEALDLPLLYLLRTLPPDRLADLPDCSEGLENRLKACAAKATTREELLAMLKTRRYSYARLNRLCTHAMLGITRDFLGENPAPRYARLLGLRDSTPLTRVFGSSGIPILTRAAEGNLNDPLYRLDIRSYDLWCLGAGIPAGALMTQGVAILR